MKKAKIDSIKDLTHVRNGIGGKPFAQVHFSFSNNFGTFPNLIATIGYDNEGNHDQTDCRVLDLDDLEQHWCGELIGALLVKAIKEGKLV